MAEQFAENASDDALAHLREAADILERAYYSCDLVQILAAKKHFYGSLCRGARNMIVLDMLNQLNSRVNQLRTRSLSRPNRFGASMDEIRELITALENRDPVAAHIATLRTCSECGCRCVLTDPDENATSVNDADESAMPQPTPNLGRRRARASD